MTKEILVINGAWYVDDEPNCVIAEFADGSLQSFDIAPYRALDGEDFRPYNGQHPRRLKGQPLPEYLYRYYGMGRSAEALTEVKHFRLTPSEAAKLEAAAANVGKTASEFFRAFVRSL